MASVKKPTTRKGYGAMLYHAIEAHGGHYCPDCHCYVQADHAICDRNWFARTLEKIDGEWCLRTVVSARPGYVELAGPVWNETQPDDACCAECAAPGLTPSGCAEWDCPCHGGAGGVPEPICQAVAA